MLYSRNINHPGAEGRPTTSALLQLELEVATCAIFGGNSQTTMWEIVWESSIVRARVHSLAPLNNEAKGSYASSTGHDQREAATVLS